ncbi:MAG: hypothetical protein VKL39_05215 [Leptolyngbyaceae bacterium]|nr:hypothetical protein [Leptolyngbyaceae bacterium]
MHNVPQSNKAHASKIAANKLDASNISEWFPRTEQNRYVEAIAGQSGLTRKQATCLVRLWGYAVLQHSGKSEPITSLNQQVTTVICSHRDAANLFYYDQSRGSERSAGMMIDQLVEKRLMQREPFDGGPTRLSLQIPETFIPKDANPDHSSVYADAFQVRRDTSFVATLIEDSYSWVSHQVEAPTFQITKGLRRWYEKCPNGLRVLRKESDQEPVGFAALYPVHGDSEENFHYPPGKSLYLSTPDIEDPMKMAPPGDATCYAIFIRAWRVEWSYWNYGAVSLFLEDTQNTLRQMQAQYPNLCDVYSMAIHPRLEALASVLGFKQMKADPTSALRWIYIPLDRFLALDIDDVIADFDFSHT